MDQCSTLFSPNQFKVRRVLVNAKKKVDTGILPVDLPVNTKLKSVPPSSEVRNEALAGVLYQIDRSYGKGSIQRLGEAHKMLIETTPTGALTLDIALGGGYPKGRVVEIYGPESSGKTTLALHAIAEIQKLGGHDIL